MTQVHRSRFAPIICVRCDKRIEVHNSRPRIPLCPRCIELGRDRRREERRW